MEGSSGGGGGGMGGTTAGGGGGNDVELMCKTLQVEHKLFYFDLKENPRGRYLKISEKTSATRSTIIVPFSGIPWFLDLFSYYIHSDDPEVFSKELQFDSKVFYFDVGENRRGRFLKEIKRREESAEGRIAHPLYVCSNVLFKSPIFSTTVLGQPLPPSHYQGVDLLCKIIPTGCRCAAADCDHLGLYSSFIPDSPSTPLLIPLELHLHVSDPVSEASVSRNRSTIIIPAGNNQEEGWTAFRSILAEINESSRLFILPNQENSEHSERLVGLTDDVGAGFISGHSSQPGPTSDLNVDRQVDLSAQEEMGSLGVSKVIRVDQKRFFFDLGSNNRGHFLRISEVAGADRSSIILPLSGLKPFYEIVGHFVDITKDRIEGMTGVNVRTVDPPHR